MSTELEKAFADLVSCALGQNLDVSDPAVIRYQIVDGISVFLINTTSLTLEPGAMARLKQAMRNGKFKVSSRGTEFKVKLFSGQASIDLLKKLRKQMDQKP